MTLTTNGFEIQDPRWVNARPEPSTKCALPSPCRAITWGVSRPMRERSIRPKFFHPLSGGIESPPLLGALTEPLRVGFYLLSIISRSGQGSTR